MKKVIVLLLAMMVAGFARTAHASWWVRGRGNDSCGKYLAAAACAPLGKSAVIQRQGETYWSDAEGYADWINGILTGVNFLRNDEAHQIVTDQAGLDLWFRHWCDAHPTATLFDAVVAFVNEPENTGHR